MVVFTHLELLDRVVLVVVETGQLLLITPIAEQQILVAEEVEADLIQAHQAQAAQASSS